jgi:hypothetical protein
VSTQGGRSHLPQSSREAKRARRELAWQAYHLRVIDGRYIRDIASELDVSKSTVGRWLPLADVYALCTDAEVVELRPEKTGL